MLPSFETHHIYHTDFNTDHTDNTIPITYISMIPILIFGIGGTLGLILDI